MRYRIRHMKSGDSRDVLALWTATPGVGVDPVCDSRAGLSRYLKRNPKSSFIAVADGKIVGTVLAGHDGRRGYLYHLAVAPGFRRHGIARALVSSCLMRLKQERIPKCTLFVFGSNRSGQTFWKKSGWKRRNDLVVMQKPF
jgi:ribosomal protein S18 acetylase RimI-like enzyme